MHADSRMLNRHRMLIRTILHRRRDATIRFSNLRTLINRQGVDHCMHRGQHLFHNVSVLDLANMQCDSGVWKDLARRTLQLKGERLMLAWPKGVIVHR